MRRRSDANPRAWSFLTASSLRPTNSAVSARLLPSRNRSVTTCRCSGVNCARPNLIWSMATCWSIPPNTGPDEISGASSSVSGTSRGRRRTESINRLWAMRKTQADSGAPWGWNPSIFSYTLVKTSAVRSSASSALPLRR